MDEQEWDEQISDIHKRHEGYLKQNIKQQNERKIIFISFIAGGLLTILLIILINMILRRAM